MMVIINLKKKDKTTTRLLKGPETKIKGENNLIIKDKRGVRKTVPKNTELKHPYRLIDWRSKNQVIGSSIGNFNITLGYFITQ